VDEDDGFDAGVWEEGGVGELRDLGMNFRILLLSKHLAIR
jgi:hypothetical protein